MGTLAPSCSQCAFFRPSDARCLRHAPGIGYEELELTHWPIVKPTDRCGVSEAVGDGNETVPCSRCIHWFQPNGIGIKPDYRQGMSVAWWEQSGFCTRYAPGPSNDSERQAHWHVTHAADRCGDGEAAKVNKDDDVAAAPHLPLLPAE